MPGGNCTSHNPGCIPPVQWSGAPGRVPAARCRVSGTAPWAAGREGRELGAYPEASVVLGGTFAETVPAGSLLDKRARTLGHAPVWVPARPADAVLRGPGTTQIASRFPGWHCRSESRAAQDTGLSSRASAASGRILEGTAKDQMRESGSLERRDTDPGHKQEGSWEPHAMKRRMKQSRWMTPEGLSQGELWASSLTLTLFGWRSLVEEAESQPLH